MATEVTHKYRINDDKRTIRLVCGGAPNKTTSVTYKWNDVTCPDCKKREGKP